MPDPERDLHGLYHPGQRLTVLLPLQPTPHRRPAQRLADLIVPLAYAWEGQSQLGKDVYRYKRDRGHGAATAIGNLSALVYTFGTLPARNAGWARRSPRRP